MSVCGVNGNEQEGVGEVDRTEELFLGQAFQIGCYRPNVLGHWKGDGVEGPGVKSPSTDSFADVLLVDWHQIEGPCPVDRWDHNLLADPDCQLSFQVLLVWWCQVPRPLEDRRGAFSSLDVQGDPV